MLRDKSKENIKEIKMGFHPERFTEEEVTGVFNVLPNNF